MGGSLDWGKSRATSSRSFYELAAHPSIVDVVAELLGDDVMLWGATLLVRSPGQSHPCHSDIESAPHDRSTVSVWVGIKDVTAESSLIVVPRSHRFGVTIQEERSRKGIDRNTVGIEQVEGWARDRDPDARVVVPRMSDGDALFFDGQLWHGSNNRSERHRHAVLLQYATPGTEIRIPDFNSLDWPFTYLDLPRPPCLMIRGSGSPLSNRFVPPPAADEGGGRTRLSSHSHRLGVPLASDDRTGWRPYDLFKGTTANHEFISCHVSALTRGTSPHPPHRHREEELLLLLEGEVDLILPDLGEEEDEQRIRLRPGQFVYYPAHFAHTLEGVSEIPANYLMFKWYSHPPSSASEILRYRLCDGLDRRVESDIEEGFRPRVLFAGPTSCLRRLQAHVSTVTPGAGYDDHVDAHDVGLIVFAGRIEAKGAEYGPNSVLFFAAGEPHGLKNPGNETARYLVFEFHGHKGAVPSLPGGPSGSFLGKATDLRRWKASLRRMIERFR